MERFDIGVNYFFSLALIGLGVNSINAVLKVDIGAPLLEVEGEAVDKEIHKGEYNTSTSIIHLLVSV